MTAPPAEPAIEPVRLIAWVRIGWLGALPSSVVVSPSALELRIPVMGRYRLAPEDVIAFDTSHLVHRVRVVHVRPDVPRSILLTPVGSHANLLKRIADAGFVARAQASSPPALPLALSPGFVALIVLAQLAFGVASAVATNPRPAIDPLALVFVGGWLVVCLLLRIDGPFRRFALSSPEAFGRVRPWLNTSTVILAVMALGLLWELFGG